MITHILDDENSLVSSFAEYVISQVNRFVESQGFCNIALAGGNSPKAVYSLLASPLFKDRVDWTNVCFFFGDERYVPADHPRYNGLMVENAFFQPMHIAKNRIFKVDTTLPPVLAAEQYMAALKGHFKHKPMEFELVILGLGDNAHTASLFPYTKVLKEIEPTVKAVFLKKEDDIRITMTAPLINQAKQIAFLVYGTGKAAAVKQVIQGIRNSEQFPAQLIKPVRGELHWFLDAAAASLISDYRNHDN